jgi:hypothetical protein
MKRYNIEVRKRGVKYLEPGIIVEVVQRVLRAESIGNFNPVFCIYKGVRILVHSFSGDLSDPFRATAEYLNHLYIEI